MRTVETSDDLPDHGEGCDHMGTVEDRKLIVLQRKMCGRAVCMLLE